MLTMTIHHGEEVQRQKLPCDFLSLRMSLYEMNLMRAPEEVSVRDVNASFESDDPIGQKFISLIRPTDLLSDIDLATHQLKTAPVPIQDALRQELQNGNLETIDDIHIGRDWICGQNSDGFGEGFEQRPIETVNGDLYVHFWSSDPDYFIATEEELDQELSAQTWGCLGI